MTLRRFTAAACVLFGMSAIACPARAQGAAQPSVQMSTATQRTTPAYSHAQNTPLSMRISELLSDEAVAHAHWGIAVTALDGTPIYGLDEGKLFRPASTAKLFTTAAAMGLLHPEATFSTRLYGTLDAENGIVAGDLVLLGGGDADFGSGDLPYVQGNTQRHGTSLRDLQNLADQLAARGVREIKGGVVGDDSLFPYEPYPQGWSDEDAVWGYGAPVSALSIANNQLLMTVTPGTPTASPGQASPSGASVTLQQYGIPYYTVDSLVWTVQPGKAGISVERVPGTRNLKVYGGVALGSPPDTGHVAMDDPAAFAAAALRSLLLGRGIRVDGEARPQHRPLRDPLDFLEELREPSPCDNAVLADDGCGGSCATNVQSGSVLAQVTSAPMVQDVVFTLKTSQNLHAELLLHHLGRIAFCAKGSTIAGARLVRAFLLAAGVRDGDFTFYDGSGLSTKDLVAPRAEAQLLAYAVAQPWFAQWKAALPVGGVDGTLASRFTAPPLQGHVFAKTGTLGESRALAGYVQCASGREVIFSILDDEHEPGSSADRVAMDKIVEAIAALN